MTKLERSLYVIDDEPDMCRAIALLLATHGSPARCFPCADAFCDATGSLAPGIVVCDVMMPGRSGLDLLRELPSLGRDDPMIMIAGHGDIPLAVEAVKLGAFDFLPKPFDPPHLLRTIAGARRSIALRDQARSLLSDLSKREAEVLALIVAGMTSKRAAIQLGISHRTVETYRVNLMQKTGVSSLPELVRFAVETDPALYGTHVIS